jgi:hypothetical protein
MPPTPAAGQIAALLEGGIPPVLASVDKIAEHVGAPDRHDDEKLEKSFLRGYQVAVIGMREDADQSVDPDAYRQDPIEFAAQLHAQEPEPGGPDDPGHREGAIHGYFGLSYANYLVIPRTLLQSMPLAWQQDVCALLDQLNDAFNHVNWDGPYEVRVLARYREHITEEPCLACDGLGETPEARPGHPPNTCPDCDGDGEVDCDRLETAEEVGVITDPVPHYNRGRERVTRVPFARLAEDLKVGDWAEVLDEHDIPAICRPNGEPTRGRVDQIDGDTAILWVPIGGADVDEHSQAVPYPLEHLQPCDPPEPILDGPAS